MYLKVDKVKYSNASFKIVPNEYTNYTAENLPILTNIKKIELFDNNNIKLREDLVSEYHRYESGSGYLLLTNNKLQEYKSAIDINGFYVCQATLEEGVIIYPTEQELFAIDLPAPEMKKWAGEVLGFIRPKYDREHVSWIEGATIEEQEIWEQAHPKIVNSEDRIAAAEQAILALMNMQ